MSVKGVVKEIKYNVNDTSKMGKDYTYTRFVYTTETGEDKTKRVFKDAMLEGIKVGDNVEVSFKKNDQGYFDLASVQKLSAVVAEAKQTANYTQTTKYFSDRDIEIQVMNALNVAASGAFLELPELFKRTQAILAAKSALVAYAEDVRTKGNTVEGNSNDPFEGIN